MSEIEQEQERWAIHPIYTDYKGSTFGRVFSKKSNRFLKGYKSQDGYTTLHLYSKEKKFIKLQIFIYECFNQQIDTSIFDIDHVNSDSNKCDYNYLRNLEKLTRPEHAQKTHGGRKFKQKEKFQKAIWRIKIQNKQEIERTKFNTVEELEVLGFKKKYVQNCCKGSQKTYKGYKFEYGEFEEKENEVWACLYDKRFRNIEVSSLGRIKNRGAISYGYKNKKGYFSKQLNDHEYQVHHLIALCFHGNPPSKSHTAHHINHIRDDNNKDNLIWKDRREQALDRTNTKKVSAYDSKTGKYLKTWDNITQAAKELKIKNSSSISQACKGKYLTASGYIWKYTQKSEQPDDQVEIQNDKKYRQIQIYDKTTKQLFKQYDSVQQAAKEFGIKNATIIKKACINKNEHLGYYWQYVDQKYYNQLKTNTRKVQAFDCETQEFINEWPSIASAARDLNIKKPGSISCACNGRTKSAGGFFWKYSE